MGYADINDDKDFDIFTVEYCNLVLQRIKNILDNKNISQGTLSTLTGIGQSTISKILSGETKMSLVHISRICRSLKIDPAEILYFGKSDKKTSDSFIFENSTDDNKIFITNPNNLAFKGYLEDFNVYFNSTISSEDLLYGKLSFCPSTDKQTCIANLKLTTGKMDKDGNEITKNYTGALIISLSMSSCYVMLTEKDIGEMCFIIFHHMFLFNQVLSCRLGCALTTSSGGNRRPTMHRIIISHNDLNWKDINNEDYKFIKGQLKLNNSTILISESNFNLFKQNEIATIESDDLKKILELYEKNYSLEKYYCIDESYIRNAPFSAQNKAKFITFLRQYSLNDRYNKISTKSDEYLYNYIDSKTN